MSTEPAPVVEFTAVSRPSPASPPVEAPEPRNLVITRRDPVAVGPSGSRKSTLLNAVGLLDRSTIGFYASSGSPL